MNYLPETLIWISYGVLTCLAVFVIARVHSVYLWYRKRPDRKWLEEGAQLSNKLRHRAGILDGLRQELDRGMRDRPDDKIELRDQIVLDIKQGPNRDLMEWCKPVIKATRSPLHQVVEHYINQNRDNPTHLSPEDAAADILRFDARSIQMSCNAAAAIAPFGGVLGTMGGVMLFLIQMASAASAGEPMPDLWGVSSALLTTAIGAVIAILAITLSYIVQAVFHRTQNSLANALVKVIRAHRKWCAAALKAKKSAKESTCST